MRSGGSAARAGWQPGDPTPDEISAVCREIQRGWSQAEFYRRAGCCVPARLASKADRIGGRVQRVTIRVVTLGDGVGEPVSELNR